jgi:hypothetical protein
MEMQHHKLYLDRKFGIDESIRVLRNAGIKGEPIELLESYRDKLEEQAAELDRSKMDTTEKT